MKFAIVVGHKETAQGAPSDYLGMREYEWNDGLASRIMEVESTVEKRVFYRNGLTFAQTYAATDAWGADITTELHFNWSDNEDATGTAVLYYPGSAKGRRFAKLLFEKTREALSLPIWPAGTNGYVTPYQASGEERRGEVALAAGRAPATLMEPFFGSSEGDCQVAEANIDAYARSIVSAADAYFET